MRLGVVGMLPNTLQPAADDQSTETRMIGVTIFGRVKCTNNSIQFYKRMYFFNFICRNNFRWRSYIV